MILVFFSIYLEDGKKIDFTIKLPAFLCVLSTLKELNDISFPLGYTENQNSGEYTILK